MAGPQQWSETGRYIGRLQEAIDDWHNLVERAVLVVLRQVIDGSIRDEQIEASMNSVPDWLA
jgi:hypothetical protein